jgi:hypothetical protein
MARLALARRNPIFRIKYDQTKLDNSSFGDDEYRGHRISALRSAAAQFLQAARCRRKWSGKAHPAAFTFGAV